jgi:two-component system sensor histidine kinase HydH
LREAIADIDEETTRLNRIVAEVLDFAKPIQFEFAEANLNEICEMSAAAAAAGSRNRVAFDFDRALPPIVTDAERLRTALVNILTNAFHAVHALSQAGTGTHGAHAPTDTGSSIALSTRRHGNRVTISIQDEGIGIAREHMAHIFDPYFTTRRAGTGLGLPIAKNIIDGLGGTISVASQEGQGTEIRVTLPMSAADSQS